MAESVDDVVKEAAAAQTAAAGEVSAAAKAESARHTAEAAQAATAAAEAASALAQANAAKTVQENEGNVEWLKQHAQATESSLASLHESHNQLRESLPGMIQSSQEAALNSIKELLTPPTSIDSGIPEVDPDKQSADQDALLEVEKKKKESQKPKRSWI